MAQVQVQAQLQEWVQDQVRQDLATTSAAVVAHLQQQHHHRFPLGYAHSGTTGTTHAQQYAQGT